MDAIALQHQQGLKRQEQEQESNAEERQTEEEEGEEEEEEEPYSVFSFAGIESSSDEDSHDEASNQQDEEGEIKKPVPKAAKTKAAAQKKLKKKKQKQKQQPQRTGGEVEFRDGKGDVEEDGEAALLDKLLAEMSLAQQQRDKKKAKRARRQQQAPLAAGAGDDDGIDGSSDGSGSDEDGSAAAEETEAAMQQQAMLDLIFNRIGELEYESSHITSNPLAAIPTSPRNLARSMGIVLDERDKRLQAAENKMLNIAAMHESNANQGSKAIASQYYHRQFETFDKTAAAVRHHTGSHYVMAGGVQFQRGERVKGVVSRHSKQAAVRNGKKSRASKLKSSDSLGMLGDK